MSGTAQNDEKYKNSLVRLGKAFWQLPRSHTPWPHLGNDHSPKLRRGLMWLQFDSLSNIITKICFWLAQIVRLWVNCLVNFHLRFGAVIYQLEIVGFRLLLN